MPRLSALHILHQTLDRGTPLDEAFAADNSFPNLSDQNRAFCRHLVATAIRRRGQIDSIIDRCLERPLPESGAGARQILRIGACQILFMAVPDYAAVNSSVDLAGRIKSDNFRGLINGVLRRIGRDGPKWLAEQDAARLNTPDWLWQSWLNAYGEDTARDIATAHLNEPPLDLSVKRDPDAWAEKLGATKLPNGSLRLLEGGRIAELGGFAEGAWWVQDAAATLPASLIGAQPGQYVIDLCAAPGGKTIQLANAGARVTAVDRSKPRMKRLTENLSRVGLTAEAVVADAATWTPSELADAVLVDAPCTATGTIRRHPDIAWLKSPDDVAATTGVQQRLLAAAASMLRPGGRLVYAVCSLEQDEGPAVVEAALADGVPLVRAPIAAHECGGLENNLSASGELRILPSQWPDLGGVDGFFISRLQRTA